MPLLRRVEQGQCDGCAWLETKLQRQRDGEQWAVDMLLMGDVDELLRDSGMLDDNTLVIFTSDNGSHEEGGADPTFFNRDGKLYLSHSLESKILMSALSTKVTHKKSRVLSLKRMAIISMGLRWIEILAILK